MKYCTSNHQQELTRKKVDELRFNVHNLNGALSFLENHSNYRVLIEIPELSNAGIELNKLLPLAYENPQIVLDLYKLEDLITVAKNAIKPCSYMYHFQVNNWGFIQILLYYKVSDILLGEPLTFQMDKVKKNIKENFNVKIRICPHVAPSYIAKECFNGTKNFWVLPQHISLYEDTVDVCDILDPNVIREQTLVDLYTCNKPYEYVMDTLITNMSTKVYASKIDEKLIRRRKNCGQVCMENNNKCHLCDTYFALASKPGLLKKES